MSHLPNLQEDPNAKNWTKTIFHKVCNVSPHTKLNNFFSGNLGTEATKKQPILVTVCKIGHVYHQ